MAGLFNIGTQQAMLAVRIRLELEKRQWGVHQLAKQANLPLRAVQRICAGEGKQTSIWTLAHIARTLGVSVDYLIGLADDEEPADLAQSPVVPDALYPASPAWLRPRASLC